MTSNLELFLVAILHGSLIAAVLLVAVSAVAAGLLLAFSVGLLCVTAVDLLRIWPLASWWFESAKANLELGFVLVVCAAMDRIVWVALALEPSYFGVVSEFKAVAVRLRAFVDSLKLN